MTCPDVGALRAWIDEEGEAPASEVAAHLANCGACHGELERLRADARLAGRAVRSLRPTAEPSPAALALARQRVELLRRGEPSNQERQPMSLTNRFARWRIAAGGLAAAVVLAFVVGTADGRNAAASFLAQFRSQTIQPITIDSSLQQSPLGRLDRLGTVQGGHMP